MSLRPKVNYDSVHWRIKQPNGYSFRLPLPASEFIENCYQQKAKFIETDTFKAHLNYTNQSHTFCRHDQTFPLFRVPTPSQPNAQSSPSTDSLTYINEYINPSIHSFEEKQQIPIKSETIINSDLSVKKKLIQMGFTLPQIQQSMNELQPKDKYNITKLISQINKNPYRMQNIVDQLIQIEDEQNNNNSIGYNCNNNNMNNILENGQYPQHNHNDTNMSDNISNNTINKQNNNFMGYNPNNNNINNINNINNMNSINNMNNRNIQYAQQNNGNNNASNIQYPHQYNNYMNVPSMRHNSHITPQPVIYGDYYNHCDINQDRRRIVYGKTTRRNDSTLTTRCVNCSVGIRFINSLLNDITKPKVAQNAGDAHFGHQLICMLCSLKVLFTKENKLFYIEHVKQCKDNYKKKVKNLLKSIQSDDEYEALVLYLQFKGDIQQAINYYWANKIL